MYLSNMGDYPSNIIKPISNEKEISPSKSMNCAGTIGISNIFIQAKLLAFLRNRCFHTIFGQPLKVPASSPLKTCSSLAAVFGHLVVLDSQDWKSLGLTGDHHLGLEIILNKPSAGASSQWWPEVNMLGFHDRKWIFVQRATERRAFGCRLVIDIALISYMLSSDSLWIFLFVFPFILFRSSLANIATKRQWRAWPAGFSGTAWAGHWNEMTWGAVRLEWWKPSKIALSNFPDNHMASMWVKGVIKSNCGWKEEQQKVNGPQPQQKFSIPDLTAQVRPLTLGQRDSWTWTSSFW